MTTNWLERSELLLGAENLQRLRKANVLIVGVGGVGAYAAEMIVRSGVGRMTIADSDTVSESNINRQLIALHSTVGRSKTELLAERLKDINPDLELRSVDAYIKDEMTDVLLDSERFDYVVDAIDTLSPKLAWIEVIVWSVRWEREPNSTRHGWRLPTSRRPTTARWHTCCASGCTKSGLEAVSRPFSQQSHHAKRQ